MTFRRKLFLAAFATALVTVAVATALVSWSVRRELLERIEQALVTEATLVAELVAGRTDLTGPELDAEAEALGARIDMRVTFIGADGRILGESGRRFDELPEIESHAARPEVIDARRTGAGVATRYSTTVGAEMMYVAVPVPNERSPVSIVRLALPLTDVARQLGEVRRIAALALGLGLLTAAAFAWGLSTLIARRVQAIADAAERYGRGDFSRPPADYGRDEIGTVARVLDQAARELSARLTEQARDRALTGAILAGMSEGLIVIDRRGQVQLVNDAARRMIHLTQPGEGRHYLEAVRHPGIAAQLTAALAGDTPPPAEVVLAAGADQVLIARTAAVDMPDGRIAVAVLHDISDLKRADRVRRDFVANISHELRTPLTAVRGYVETLLDDPPDAAQTRRFLEIVARHSSRMERLVRDLLRLARIEGGQEPLERASVPMANLFSDVQGAMAALVDSRHQRVETRVEAGAEEVDGDPAKLHDVLRNLLENASAYAPGGTTIRMRAWRDKDRVLLEVEDEGPGIPEADLPRIFERFYRVDKARGEGGGTGLGLAIVKHLVGLHGGTVEARNRPDGGAVFTVAVPSQGSGFRV
jgi:two-component system, OmpR family, phosphate regulon sensor histidine kinase PhoR